ncbi:MAG: ATP-dependent DNA helicase, partial [Nostoc sp.]
VDDLEDWVRDQLTQDIQPDDWDQLMLACPNEAEAIREARIQLTHELFQHPANPYECYLISQPEIEILSRLHLALKSVQALPESWKQFWQQFQTLDENLSPHPLFWATIAHRQG